MPDNLQIIHREERFRLPVALLSIGGVALVIASLAVLSAGLPSTDTDPEQLREIHAHSGTVLVSYLLQGLGFLVFAAPLVYLFRAAEARSDAVRGGMIGLTVLGPLLLGAAAVVHWLYLRDAANDFVNAGVAGREGRNLASDLLGQGTLHDMFGALGFGGAIGLAAAVLYCCLHGMRTGLLNRFWGSLGMAAGVVSILIPLFLLAWFVYFGLLVRGWVPGGRPPAWAAGEAIPWPTPGEEPEEQPRAEQGGHHRAAPGVEDEEAARTDSSPSEGASVSDSSRPSEGSKAGSSEGSRSPSRRKRKRRR